MRKWENRHLYYNYKLLETSKPNTNPNTNIILQPENLNKVIPSILDYAFSPKNILTSTSPTISVGTTITSDGSLLTLPGSAIGNSTEMGMGMSTLSTVPTTNIPVPNTSVPNTSVANTSVANLFSVSGSGSGGAGTNPSSLLTSGSFTVISTGTAKAFKDLGDSSNPLIKITSDLAGKMGDLVIENEKLDFNL
mgnify:CR=1 FL=1